MVVVEEPAGMVTPCLNDMRSWPPPNGESSSTSHQGELNVIAALPLSRVTVNTAVYVALTPSFGNDAGPVSVTEAIEYAGGGAGGQLTAISTKETGTSQTTFLNTTLIVCLPD